MSKLLRKQKDMLPEENSFHISQMKASIDSLIATHTGVATAHHAAGVSQATYDADNAFGAANKRWKNCIFAGDATSFAAVTVFQAVRNVGATNINPTYEIPLPVVINGKNLVITQIKLGLIDADGNNFVDVLYLQAVNNADPPVASNLITDGTNRIAAGIYTYDIADQTIGGSYEKTMVYMNCINATQNLLDIGYVQVEYYYT